MVDKNIIDTLLNDVLTRQTSRLPQNVEAMNLQRQLWENLKNETYRPNFRLRGSSPLQFGGPTSFSKQLPMVIPQTNVADIGSKVIDNTMGKYPEYYRGTSLLDVGNPVVDNTPKATNIGKKTMDADEILDFLFKKGSNKQVNVSFEDGVYSSGGKKIKAPQIFKNPLLKKLSPWLLPIQSGVQAYSNEQRLREMEKWNEYMASQGKPPMYSDEAIKAQKTRGYTASAPLASTIVGGLFGGAPGAIAGGGIGEVANIIGGMLPQQSGYTRAPLTGKYRGMEINQLPQFKGPNGEIITTVDQLENVLNNKPGATQSAPAMEEIPSLDKLPPIPEGLGKVDYTEDFINNLVATNGLGVDAPQLRGYANTTPIVEQVTPQTAYDNIYKDLLASREKALANQRENIEQLIDAYRTDVKGLRRANLIDTITNSLVGIANPQWQVTMPMLSGNITYGSTPNKEATPATDYIKSAPLKSEVTSAINKLQEASDQAEVDFELAQAELLDKVNIANQLGLPVSMVNKDLLKAQMDNATKEKIANLENARRLYVQSMISGDKAEQRKLTKAVKEAENEVKLHIANQLASQRMATGLMNYFGNAFGDYSALPYITPLLDNPEFESKIQEIINNQGGSQYGYGE